MDRTEQTHEGEREPLLLEMRGICKYFPGVKALDGVDFRLRRGSVHALMGENGAGKSTLMKCLFGMYEKDRGEVLLEGERVDFKNPVDALRHGVAMVHQELNQALSRTVMDNIWLGRYPTVGGVVVSERKMLQDTGTIFESLGITVDPQFVARNVFGKRRAEVVAAYAAALPDGVITVSIRSTSPGVSANRSISPLTL